MPMFRDFVPKKIRPWIYVFFAFCFLLSGGIYSGTIADVMGEYSLKREDVMMVVMCNVIGVAMPFPFLFKMKFAYTNRRLLLNAALGVGLCNILIVHTQSLPMMCLLAYVSGFFKLCGCFECMSTVQLWMTPKREFPIFFPLLYIMVLGCGHYLSAWMSCHLGYIYQEWRMMNMLEAGLMLLIFIVLKICTKPCRFMRQIPFVSADYLGLFLFSALMLEFVFFFNYGEYYNWLDGRPMRQCLLLFALTLALCLGRMRRIRHPYIDPGAWKYPRLIPLLILFAFMELMSSVPQVLQSRFTGAVLHWGAMTTSVFYMVQFAACVAGCLFVLVWIKVWRQTYTRLLTVGALAVAAYPVMMYFLIDPGLNIEKFYLPVALSSFGNAIFFTALTIYLQELMPFHHFFMGLTMAGFVRNGPISALCSGLCSFFLRRQTAVNMSRGLPYGTQGLTMLSLKQLLGVMSLVGCAVALVFLLWDIQPVRKVFKRMSLWPVVGRMLRIKEGAARANL